MFFCFFRSKSLNLHSLSRPKHEWNQEGPLGPNPLVPTKRFSSLTTFSLLGIFGISNPQNPKNNNIKHKKRFHPSFPHLSFLRRKFSEQPQLLEKMKPQAAPSESTARCSIGSNESARFDAFSRSTII